MIRQNRRRRGRPEGQRPSFVEDFARLDATKLLAKSRGCFVNDPPGDSCTLTWSEWGHQRTRTFPILVTTTPEPLGGSRRWWSCPTCRRRCGVLLIAPTLDCIGCRVCFDARYQSDYMGRHRRCRGWQLIMALFEDPTGGQRDVESESLLAERRRGVRRGRRVLRRQARHLFKRMGEAEQVPALFAALLK
jgi:hypothetical protein